MHLTSGIIDEHSHIAISKGVNEGGQAISAEVSISDVVNSDDINIYRQLAGGNLFAIASWFGKSNWWTISYCKTKMGRITRKNAGR